MKSSNTNRAVSFCEDCLKEQRDHFPENPINPGVPSVSERMLERRNELQAAYEDIAQSLGYDHHRGWFFFDALQCSISVWSPDDIRGVHDDKRRLQDLNEQIVEASSELQALLQERDELSNRSSVNATELYSISQIILLASKENHAFQSWVADPLTALETQFDWKYWPSIADCIGVIEDDALSTKVKVQNEVSKAGLRGGRRAPRADFLRAFMKRVEKCKDTHPPSLSSDFRLKDETWASLTNVLLDLDEHELITSEYVKNLRHRDRQYDQ